MDLHHFAFVVGTTGDEDATWSLRDRSRAHLLNRRLEATTPGCGRERDREAALFFLSAGMLLARFFRFWAFKRWVFPDELGRCKRALTAVDDPAEELGHS